ncbi:MAG: hypothetical protein AABY64_01940 [Bdellovibrionota bacterium]
MKSTLVICFFALVATLSGSLAHARCDDGPKPDEGDYFLALLTTTTLPPLTTTTIIACALADSAEVNKMMIQREATMVTEENKMYVPSFLGTYADQQNMELREAAKDVLANGVRP